MMFVMTQALKSIENNNNVDLNDAYNGVSNEEVDILV